MWPVVLLLAAAAMAAGGRLYTVGNTELTVWGDRDLWRGLEAWRHWPVLGPETNRGVRTPGGAFYLLLARFLAIHPGIPAASFGVVLLFAASTLVLGIAFAGEVSPLAGALAAADRVTDARGREYRSLGGRGFAVTLDAAGVRLERDDRRRNRRRSESRDQTKR